MTRLGFTAASVYLFVFAMPAAAVAQSATSSGQSPFNSQRDQSTRAPTLRAPTTGVFCTQEMTATFCNVVTGPNTNGYGRNAVGSTGAAGVGGTAGAGGAAASSLPPCPSHPPFNELCD
jgi:hypothetical protein